MLSIIDTKCAFPLRARPFSLFVASKIRINPENFDTKIRLYLCILEIPLSPVVCGEEGIPHEDINQNTGGCFLDYHPKQGIISPAKSMSGNCQ